MRILADLHISPRTVSLLRGLGHDVVRVNEILPATAADREILTRAAADQRAILTQDLDFSALTVLPGNRFPSVVSLRLASSRVEAVNEVLRRALPVIEAAVIEGAIVSIGDTRIRIRRLPVE